MKKYLAPILIAVFLILYVILYVGVFMMLIKSLALKIILGIIPVFFAGVMIFVLIERIKEIRSGEEDDLGKY